MAGEKFKTPYLLNNPKMREALRQYKLIESIEGSFDGFADLKLTGVQADEQSIIASYRCIGSKDVYPHVRSRLIERGAIKKSNVRSCNKKNSGQPNEYEHLHLVDEGAMIQVHLKVFNPNVLGDAEEFA